jgi:tRNA (guanine6-N2)-methyltransferase
MPKSTDTPACYALVHSGLEEIAADEIRDDFRGEVKKAAKSIVVFRVPTIDRHILNLRTTEDVYLFGWGTDELSFRAVDLDSIAKWTRRDADWTSLLKVHHAVRPKHSGKPSYRLVVQMTGEHGYRRIDASKAFRKGLEGVLLPSWREAEENAAIEFWLTIHGSTAVSGIRLSDRTMRHRTYKFEHFAASLRPTVAAAMARLANLKPNQTIVDPFCGAGTILAETLQAIKQASKGNLEFWQPTLIGGDIDPHHLRSAQTNLRNLGDFRLDAWDARRLPLEDASVDRIVSNPPFGKQMSSEKEIGPLYRQAIAEMDRVLKSRGQVVLLTADAPVMKEAINTVGWKQSDFVPIRILGQPAVILGYRKS